MDKDIGKCIKISAKILRQFRQNVTQPVVTKFREIVGGQSGPLTSVGFFGGKLTAKRASLMPGYFERFFFRKSVERSGDVIGFFRVFGVSFFSKSTGDWGR